MKRLFAAGVLASLLLAACGGGGSDAGTPPPTNDFNALAAWQSLLTGTRNWSVSGQGSDRLNYRSDISISPGAAVAFPVTGVVNARANFASTVFENGVSLGTGLTEYFYDAGFATRGVRSSSSLTATTCEQILSAAVPPAAAKVNATGALFTATSLNQCAAGAPVQGSSRGSWSLEFEAGVVFLCINAVGQDLGGAESAEGDCFEIDAAGNIGSRARISLVAPGFTLAMRNY